MAMLLEEGFGGFGGFAKVWQGGFGFGFDDIFEEFFGGSPFGGATRTRRPNSPQRGSDLRYDLEITLEDAAFGLQTTITVPRTENCDACGGSGAKPGTKPETCTHCHGSGQQQVVRNTAFGRFVSVRTCSLRWHGNHYHEHRPQCQDQLMQRRRKIG